MPKRTIHDIDSEDSFCLQSKIHVSNKEINQGIGAASNMKEVYRRTLDLLFRGAKSKSEQQTIIPQAADNEEAKNCEMIVTESGMIRQFSPVRELPVSTKCLSCLACRPTGFERCRFCEGYFCEACFKPCERCYGNYCAKCSIQMYSREESCICLSCATTRGPM